MKKIALLFIAYLISGCMNPTPKNYVFTIGFSQCMADDAWRKIMNDEIRRELSFYPDYDLNLLYRDAHYSTSNQKAQIKELLEHQVDLLIVSPNEAEPLTELIDSIYNLGIPVIIIDREINSSNFTAYVGAENIDIGREAGKYTAELLKGNGKVVEITGLRSSTPAMERSQGYYESLSKYPKIEILRTFEGKWVPSEVYILKDSLLPVLNTCDLVYVHNDPMAKAVKELTETLLNDPVILGIDGLNIVGGGVEMVLNDLIDATFWYPTGGDVAIQTAIKILTGEEFQKYNYLRTFRIDETNAETIFLQGHRITEQTEKIDKQREQIGELSGLIEKQNTFLFLTTIVITLLFLLAGLIAFFLYQKNRVNQQLNRKNKTIEHQNQTIVDQRDNLIQMAKVAEEATEMKIRFFTNISHEFRTALSLISHPAKKLTETNQDTTKSEDIETIWKNTERLLRLSDELLNFREIDKNKYQVEFVRNDLALFIKELIPNFELAARQKHIHIKNDFPLTLMADFDRRIIEKVLVNIVTNAIKYSAKDSNINIEVKEMEGTVLITVSDTGKGINKEELPFIFDRFYRVKQSTEGNKVSGTGIGLALSKELVQLHGGRINVNSSPEQGTQFIIKIPRYHHSVPEIEDHASDMPDIASLEPIVVNKDIKVLVVEDNIEIRKVIVEIIEKYFTVISAGDGNDGLCKVQDEHPDIVVSDILMPKMDGIELCRQVKSNPSTSATPIILLTAIDSDESKIKGFDIGADAYLTKPFNELLLLTRISGLIKSQQRFKDKLGVFSFLDHKIENNIEEQEFIDNCLTVIYDYIDETNLTLDVIAEKVFVSRSTLNRRIKEITGRKPVDFLKKAKLNYAAQLLLKSSLNVNEVSWKSGFSDAKYFSRQFQQEFNCLPSKFKAEFEQSNINF